MMSTEPSITVSSSSDSFSAPSRQRRYKIFQQKPQTQINQQQNLLLESKESRKLEKVRPFSKQRTQQGEGKGGFVKIPKKDLLEKEFYAEEDEDEQVTLLQPNLQGYCTVDSQNFGVTTQLLSQTVQPSVFLRFNSLVINEQSELFQSVRDLKSTFRNMDNETDELAQSLSHIDASVRVLVKDGESSGQKLKHIEQFLEQLQKEQEVYQKKIEQLDQRIQNLEFRESISLKSLEKSEEGQQLKVFIETKGLKIEREEERDQIVESQFLPASLIAEFMEQRRLKAQEALKNSQTLKETKELQLFHPCLGITQDTFRTLKGFISEQFKGKKQPQLRFQLIFKRSTLDIEDGFFGDKQSLEYKECLLFIIRNGAGKTFGGFISNYLIQEEIREDPHAFLFSLTEGCSKFKIKEEFSHSAYEASKHYLVCFGSDLMISSQCMQEQSYCEWPNSYEGREGDCSMNWFAGDFTFTIQHIEVYEVIIK